MSEPNLTNCKIKLQLWSRAKNMNITVKNNVVPVEFRDKCPCILLNDNLNVDTATYFDKHVTKSECQNNNITTRKNVTNNNTKYNYDKYIGEYTVTSNNNSNGKVIYYIYVYFSDELLDFINSYKYSTYFTLNMDENNTYISVSSYYKNFITELANALHKQVSNAYNTQGNKANNIPLVPVQNMSNEQAAGSRKKVKTHRKNKIVTINKKNRKTKRHIPGSK